VLALIIQKALRARTPHRHRQAKQDKIALLTTCRVLRDALLREQERMELWVSTELLQQPRLQHVARFFARIPKATKDAAKRGDCKKHLHVHLDKKLGDKQLRSLLQAAADAGGWAGIEELHISLVSTHF
jgi:hypothetical protein